MENIKLFTLVSQINELPVFPEVALKIINEVDSEDTTAQKLADIILMDTSLTLKIINISNSAYYSPRSEIKNITHAIQYLGFNTIKSIAYTSAIQVLKAGSKDDDYFVKKFHEKSIVSAYVARMIVNKINYFRKTTHTPEDYYIYGLFHDIGEIAISVFYPEYMEKLIEDIKAGTEITDLEDKFKHTQIGLMLMRKWNLPEQFAQICSKHHTMDANKVKDDVLFNNILLMIADAIAYELGYNPTFSPTTEVESLVYRIGLREADIFSKEGVLGEAEANLESQLMFLMS